MNSPSGSKTRYSGTPSARYSYAFAPPRARGSSPTSTYQVLLGVVFHPVIRAQALLLGAHAFTSLPRRATPAPVYHRGPAPPTAPGRCAAGERRSSHNSQLATHNSQLTTHNSLALQQRA